MNTKQNYSLYLFSLLFLLVINSTSTFALPINSLNNKNLELPENFTEDYNFEAIVGLSNCSGSLIRLENSEDSDPVLLLTNGHCTGRFIPVDEFIVNRPARLSFRVYNKDHRAIRGLQTTKLIYATMTVTDMAIYQTNITYSDLNSRYNIQPLLLASNHPVINTGIEVISGYWNRGYRCGIESFPYKVKEGTWYWFDSIRYSRPGCEVIGGTSGSPVIAENSRIVVGVNNTMNESGQACTVNNPCEETENGETQYTRGIGYGQQTYILYSCLNEKRELDLSLPSCGLPGATRLLFW